MIAEQDKFYTTNEAVEVLGYSLRHLYKLVKEGKIKSIKVGREHRFKGEWINDFVDFSSKK